MSRIGKVPITIPKGVTVSVDEKGACAIEGPKGTITRVFKDDVAITVKEGKVICAPTKDTAFTRALWGTYASHIKNMIAGVVEGFEKKLFVEGIGYRVQLQGNALVLSVGFSHPVEITIPEGLSVSVEKNEITISGVNKEDVGQFAARVRAIKKPEPYKGKGIRYSDEVIRRKQGKRAVA